ncbi:MAG: DUF2625 domain-containing protein [Propionibacteriaceae bacterium]|nr:DUF2625 domain-containing protein [Propionibacteriaceae bacterium]
MSRTIEELMAVDDPYFPEFVNQVAHAKNTIRVLPAAPAAGQRVLYRLQVTARSSASGTVLSSGGLIVDHGWLRVFGAGTAALPDVATASHFPAVPGNKPPELPGLFLAVDVLGGQFAIDSGMLASSPGHVCYWAPDNLKWTAFDMKQSQFLEWVCQGDLDDFYQRYRWDGWQDEVSALPLNCGIGFFPFTFTAEFDLATASRSVVPMRELIALHIEIASKMGEYALPLAWPDL